MKAFKKSCLAPVLVLLLLLIGSYSFSQEKDTNSEEISLVYTVDHKDLKWHPAPDFFPGCSFTLLHGAIEQPNLDLFFKINPNTEVINHTHNSPERMILISGELEVQYENEEPQIATVGSYLYGPSNKPHKAKCLDKGPCVLFIALEDPFNAEPIIEKD
ncbi:cupin domain-containing protein [Tamlana fucoidanivorans]|uniref:Cupin domain-containing protein n=1 Tax=Allotamlana fucoidanivorans TaxID=2583814 RepID=A0A5C4SJ09_9FLAO|nr:cupin domain-containing protein [Tamlana fucoidanivorans]TNJ43810.1 cupin domain-containing protein [Tamlana fucoidanivorans]